MPHCSKKNQKQKLSYLLRIIILFEKWNHSVNRIVVEQLYINHLHCWKNTAFPD